MKERRKERVTEKRMNERKEQVKEKRMNDRRKE